MVSMSVQACQGLAAKRHLSRFAIRLSSGQAGRYSRIFNTSGNLAAALPSHRAEDQCRTRRYGVYARLSISNRHLTSASDAVDGSSTGTLVPRRWVLVMLPRFGGANHANGHT